MSCLICGRRLKRLLLEESKIIEKEIKMKIIQLYHWGLRNEKIDTQYGEITYYEWLEKEKERITKDKSRFAEIREHGKKYALFVNDVSKKAKGR